MPDDWERLRPVVTDPRVLRYVGDGTPWPDEQARRFVDGGIEQARVRGWSRRFRFPEVISVARPANGASIHVRRKIGLRFDRRSVHDGVDVVCHSKPVGD